MNLLDSKKGTIEISRGDQTWCVASDKVIMANLVNLSGLTKDDYYLEIGTCRGKSLTAIHQWNKKVKIISIDPAPKKDCWRHYKGDPRVRIMKQKSSDAFKVLRSEGVKPSCVYIDGDHSKKWALHDIRHYWEIWDGKGFFGGHDYTRAREKGWGVMEAVREYFELPNDCVINRRFRVKTGVMHICDTFWFYIHDEQMTKYKEYLDDL